MELLSAFANEQDNPLSCVIVEVCKNSDVRLERWSVKQGRGLAPLWMRFICKGTILAQQGWKLHISASLSSAEIVLRRVLPILLNASAHFKLIASLHELASLNRGERGMSQVGKFITVYPQDDQEAVHLALRLEEVTRGMQGPTIRSDRALHPRSLVYYRYGGMSSDLYVQDACGIIEPAIKTPGNELVTDRRQMQYEAPDWVTDPFVAAGIVALPCGMKRFIGGRYLIIKTIAASLRHNVYLAGDLKAARACVIKGPGLMWENSTVDCSMNQYLRHEAEVLTRLAPHPRVPAFYDLIKEDAALFLVIEDIPGETLANHVTNLSQEGRYVAIQQIITWGLELAEVLGVIHEQGLIYADVKPSNIIIDADRHLHLIDFDHTCERGSAVPAEYGTQGYIAAHRQKEGTLTIGDDVYSFGVLLYFMVTGADPALTPRPFSVLERPPAWFRADGWILHDIITRCLNQEMEAHYTSMEELRVALSSVVGGTHVHGAQVTWAKADEPAAIASTLYGEMSKKLLNTLCSVAQCTPGQKGLFWISTHPLTFGIVPRDLNSGNAGTVLALAELIAAHPTLRQHEVLLKGSHWLCMAGPMGEQSLPGLYVGEAGVGAALLRAGQVLREQTLIDAAVARGRLVASLPHRSPDIFNGTAGRLRFHLLLWDETGEREHLQAAIACGEWLSRMSESGGEQEAYWTIPKGYRSMSGKAFLGYAHGAAGIADALLDLFEATADEQYLRMARRAAFWLNRQAIPLPEDDDAYTWPKSEGDCATAAFWCHGSAGIGRFFLHAAQHDVFPGAGEIAAKAARVVAYGTRWAGPTQCHGLAGNIELLLDMYQATRLPIYLENAFALGRCLEGYATEQNGRLVFSAEAPTTLTPDYMVGYAGVAICLLRLSAPESMPHQLSRRGFRYAVASSNRAACR